MIRWGLTICLVVLAAMALGQATKPTIKVAKDGTPTGQSTPEGAACDLARAFIIRDAALFRKVTIKPRGDASHPDDYSKFIEQMVASIKAEAKRTTPSPAGPKSIGKVFAARHLTKNGPASYGYAVFGYRDVMFVDVGCFLQDGGRSLTRTLVVQDSNGTWLADPLPTASPLLSQGLTEESPSTGDFTDKYTVAKDTGK